MIKSRLRFLISLFLTAMLFSCGGGDKGGNGNSSSTSGNKSNSRIDKARAYAEKERANAENVEAAKYAPTEWQKAEDILVEAQDYAKANNVSKASRSYYSAKSKYTTAISAAKTNKQDLADYTTIKVQVEKLLLEAKKVNAAKLAPQLFTTGKTNVTLSEKTKKTNIKKAKYLMEEANTSLNSAIYKAKEVAKQLAEQEKQKKRALEEKKAMLEKKKLASDMDTEKKHLSDIQYAEDIIKDGDRAFSDKRYQEAEFNYRDAKVAFIQLAEAIQSEKRFAEQNKKAATGPQPGYGNTPLTGPANGAKQGPGPAVSQGTEDNEPSLPSGSVFDIFVQNNFENLFSVPATYENGKVRLDYTDGALLKKDAIPNYSRKKVFEFGPKKEGRITSQSFHAGGVGGFLYLRPFFKGNLTITCNVQLEILGAQSPSVILSGVSNRGSGFGTYFGNWVGGIQSGRFRKAAPTLNSDAQKGSLSDFLDVRNPYEWKLEINCPEGKKNGTVTSYYDGSKSSVMKVETDPKKPPELMAGFTWNNCRFIVQDLIIEGTIDPKWVVSVLKKQRVEIPDEVLVAAGLKKASKKPEKGKTPPLPGGQIHF